MALVEIKTGNKQRKKFTEYVVVGDEASGCRIGDIRWVHWDRNTSSPMLLITYTSKERKVASEIRLHPDYAKRGWMLLRDMYSEVGEPNAHHWDDFVAFSEAQAMHPDSMEGKQFPEEWLPTKLIEMRKTAKVNKADRFDFQFPSGDKLSDMNKKDSGNARKRVGSA